MQASVLPTSLVEFVFLRASVCMNAARLTSRAALHRRSRLFSPLVRQLHSEVVQVAQPPPLPIHHVQGQNRYTLSSFDKNDIIPRHPGLMSELEKRVRALEEAAEKESRVLEPPSYTEEELAVFYENLLAVRTVEPGSDSEQNASVRDPTMARAAVDLAIIKSIENRLLTSNGAEDLQELDSKPYSRILAYLQDVASRIEAIRESSVAPATGIISIKECAALVRVCLQARDHLAAEKTLDITKQLGVPVPESAITDVMHVYADVGNVAGVERVMTTYMTDTPTEQQRHLHIKAHLSATPADAVPTRALQVLHDYELQSHPAPMRTYTSTITSLFSRPSSLARAQAWDLFSHMRYVAHPQPDVVLYTLMIRACASPISSARSSEPERALDLWTEMTVDRRLLPTAGAYNAVILACARSGLRRYVNEAFRLAKEMLDASRDARGRAEFRPTKKTFCALLEGAKRVKDLARARWILAEMVRGVVGRDGYGLGGANGVKEEEEISVDEEVMMHVFHAYAAYDPPFVRSIAPTAKDQELPSSQEDQGEIESKSMLNAAAEDSGLPVPEEVYPAFTHIPPQSRQEVIHEVRMLFHRILADMGRQQGVEERDDGSLPTERKLRNVTMSTRLVNSYLSVFYRHASLDAARDMFWTLFEELGVDRSARTYVEALERCSRARRKKGWGGEREVASKFVQEVWREWEKVEEEEGGGAVSPRMIERAHTAMMRTLAVCGDVDGAVAALREFVRRYPPQNVRQLGFEPGTQPAQAMRSTRTVLVGPRPLVRMTSSVEVPDDGVPPLVTFADVEVLHHRLVASEAREARKRKEVAEQIGYIKWVCKAYEGALRVRRQKTFKARVE